ncbi:transcriptional regulator, TetR family [Chitinophaga sp. CF118]|uniref:TetR/AcrR family transcriptional regulator n=1 Tax=Chitinophaga sp. CF118 TaxID=1884367 RepID=UPI0008E10676|nr:TetR/AcrR family transcriptional regulator [Chitinophaga sp. CF118]SFD88973.1 transcriptional regulator, TetR family [Chitinophaga sp. CF118]
MRQRDENKIQGIREKAIEMITNEGLENFGINKLAKAAGVSPATIYIYYKDKDDLITQISVDEGMRMCAAILEGFDPEMTFEEGLWIQWKNRAKYSLNNQEGASFYEQLRNSTYREKMVKAIHDEMGKKAGPFMKNAIERGEINDITIEVFWSVAIAPLYSLVRFHQEGHCFKDRIFVFSEKIMKETFDYVIKALKK